MLTQVDVTNPRSDTLRLLMLDASSGYAVIEIDGLDPVKATLTTSTLAQIDGAQPQNARRETRNVIIKLGLEPDYVLTTVDSLRSNLYDWFMPKSNVDMAFYKDGNIFVVASGQVESCENNMFSADPEVDISIICYDPDFYAPDEVSTVGFGTTSGTGTNTISYPGTTEAGVLVTLNIDRDLTDFTVYSTKPDNTVQVFDVSGIFMAGDVVEISSLPGAKSAVLTRAGVDSSILYWVQDNPTWIALQKGDNHFRILADGAAVPYTVTYTPKYGGY